MGTNKPRYEKGLMAVCMYIGLLLGVIGAILWSIPDLRGVIVVVALVAPIALAFYFDSEK